MAATKTKADTLFDELIVPVLPDLKRLVKDMLKKDGAGVRDVAIAKLVMEMARDIAVKEQGDQKYLRDLIRQLPHAPRRAQPVDGDDNPGHDFFEETNEEAKELNERSQPGASVNGHRAGPHDLGA